MNVAFAGVPGELLESCAVYDCMSGSSPLSAALASLDGLPRRCMQGVIEIPQ